MRTGIVALLMLACLASPRTGSAETLSDSERLSQPLPKTFQRPRVLLYPPISLIGLESRQARDGSFEATWTAMITEFSAHRNIDIVWPQDVVKLVQRRPNYALLKAESVKRAEWGKESYSEVRLRDAIKKLSDSFDALLEIEYHLEGSNHVAEIALLLAQAQLEDGRTAESEAAFRLALLMNPNLSLKSGFDRPDAIRTLERVRLKMMNSDSLVEARDRLHSPSLERSTVKTSVRTYFTSDAVVAVIRTPSGRQIERQRLTDDSTGDASRLVSRIAATLPFGYERKVRERRRFYVDTTMGGLGYASTPLGFFPHYQLSGSMNLVLGNAVSLEGSLHASNSGRDWSEHLREDLITLRARLMAGGQITRRRWSIFAHLGLEVGHRSAVIITTNVDCKFFSREDNIPPALCDFDSDFDRSEGSILMGLAATAGGRLVLTRRLFAVTRLDVSNHLIQSTAHEFQWPLGVHLGLGYQLK